MPFLRQPQPKASLHRCPQRSAAELSWIRSAESALLGALSECSSPPPPTPLVRGAALCGLSVAFLTAPLSCLLPISRKEQDMGPPSTRMSWYWTLNVPNPPCQGFCCQDLGICSSGPGGALHIKYPHNKNLPRGTGSEQVQLRPDDVFMVSMINPAKSWLLAHLVPQPGAFLSISSARVCPVRRGSLSQNPFLLNPFTPAIVVEYT